ncbi:c-type cytochrome [Pareuzebyella sediminis]|uniref:c-type cytochrome n=1 Tax=Pareuzebyella sediminis TaxID=2607998 RepID=UPI0011F03058|nr:c-type cytochrome [Pareuzebyella sediminis]
MTKYHYIVALILISFLGEACSTDNGDSSLPLPKPDTESPSPTPDPEPEPDPIIVNSISESHQRTGNAAMGYDYLIRGDYMSSGIPYQAFIAGFGEDNTNKLERLGDNAVIPYNYTAVDAPNGVRVVAPNCMSCHAAEVNGKFVVGLGNHSSDYTTNRAENITLLNSAISFLYGGESSPEWKAYDQFRKSIIAIGPNTILASKGVNPADKIAQVLIAHRDKNSLEWSDTPYVSILEQALPTDVPAWWLLKKKNAMFYTGIGRGDFCKSFIGSSLLTLANKDKAEEMDERMVDILAYIQSIEPPSYPFTIDSEKAIEGKVVFEEHCVKCHGRYGEDASYPNLMVALETVETDPELSNYYTQSSAINDYFLDWFNTGWFGTYSEPLEIFSEGGYIAPPLDGIWATAPYFHNGSVPSLYEILNSDLRPKYWSRSYDSEDYDTSKLGWNYTLESSKKDENTYDTTLSGYGNMGHTFGDVLTEGERTSLLEYLKTL